MKIALDEVIQQLPLPSTEKWPQGVWSTRAFTHGSMSLVLFTPRGRDYQSPHDQDEVYIVMQGTGEFVVENERFLFGPGDILFVPAAKMHRFENFSDDLVTWVVFWGPRGGEKSKRSDET